jgi:hypothetical protein
MLSLEFCLVSKESWKHIFSWSDLIPMQVRLFKIPFLQQQRRYYSSTINTHAQWGPKVLGRWHMFCCFVSVIQHWIWNDTMTIRLKCRRVNRLEITALFIHSLTILGDLKYWDKFTYMCIKVVKSLVFGPVFLSDNDYLKLVGCICCLFWLRYRLFCAQ